MELQGCRNPDLIPLLGPPDGFSQKGKPLWTWEKIKSGGVDAVKRRIAERRKYLRTPEGRAEMAAKRAAREEKKAQTAADRAYRESLVTRKELIEKYGCSKKEVAKLKNPDEITLIRRMGWGYRGRHYWYRLSNPFSTYLLLGGPDPDQMPSAVCEKASELESFYPFGISEAGKSIVESNERTQAASTAKFTALPSGIDKIRRALPHHALR